MWSVARSNVPPDQKILDQFRLHASGFQWFPDATGRQAAVQLLQTAILRLLATLPAGQVRLTILDPLSLGERGPVVTGLDRVGVAIGSLIVAGIIQVCKYSPFIDQRLLPACGDSAADFLAEAGNEAFLRPESLSGFGSDRTGKPVRATQNDSTLGAVG